MLDWISKIPGRNNIIAVNSCYQVLSNCGSLLSDILFSPSSIETLFAVVSAHIKSYHALSSASLKASSLNLSARVFCQAGLLDGQHGIIKFDLIIYLQACGGRRTVCNVSLRQYFFFQVPFERNFILKSSGRAKVVVCSNHGRYYEYHFLSAWEIQRGVHQILPAGQGLGNIMEIMIYRRYPNQCDPVIHFNFCSLSEEIASLNTSRSPIRSEKEIIIRKTSPEESLPCALFSSIFFPIFLSFLFPPVFPGIQLVPKNLQVYCIVIPDIRDPHQKDKRKMSGDPAHMRSFCPSTSALWQSLLLLR